MLKSRAERRVSIPCTIKITAHDYSAEGDLCRSLICWLGEVAPVRVDMILRGLKDSDLGSSYIRNFLQIRWNYDCSACIATFKFDAKICKFSNNLLPVMRYIHSACSVPFQSSFL